uniref:nephronectin-like isoform X10 n=1 Tax=Monopterus albus TaxID=43700 RepID=UPI0009B4D86F|nr:nephronectin-like isoform X10 [Monopterus albus]
MKDLNECGLKPRPCKHRCMNTAGSYKCYCVDGYAPQPHGSCRNAQTCYHANCQYGCEVIKGAVRCTCPSPGLRLGPDRCTCVDVNECVLGGGVCPRCRKCVNTFGSFLCKCHLGFKLVYINGRYTCVDKDPRPFCSLNPSSPKCRCKDAGCKGDNASSQTLDFCFIKMLCKEAKQLERFAGTKLTNFFLAVFCHRKSVLLQSCSCKLSFTPHV